MKLNKIQLPIYWRTDIMAVALLLFLVAEGRAQYVRPYKNGYTYFYLRQDNTKNPEETSLCPVSVIADTVKGAGDSVSSFNRTVNYLDRIYPCVKKDLVSNLGSSFHARSNGSFYTTNHMGDTILFHTKDTVGSTRVSYLSDSLMLRIRVTLAAKYADTILGQPDTIVRYLFTVYNIGDTLLTAHPFTTSTCLFAMRHGFTDFYDFRLFPTTRVHLSLRGRMKTDMTDRIGNTGIPDYKARDMNVGDVVEEKSTKFSVLNPPPHPPADIENSSVFTRRTVTGRLEDSSRIVITMERKRWYAGHIDSNSTAGTVGLKSSWNYVNTDTIKVTINKAGTYGNIPPVLDDFDIGVYTYIESIDAHKVDGEIAYGRAMKYSDTCWGPSLVGLPLYPSDVAYSMSGVGTGYYNTFKQAMPLGETSFHPLYAKKGNATWGTPYPFPLGVAEPRGDLAPIEVYPNPANARITVTLPGIDLQRLVVISIVDVAGHVVLNETQRLSDAVSVGSLQSGLYFLECAVGNRLFRCRFVKD